MKEKEYDSLMIRGWEDVKRSFAQVKDFLNETFRQELPSISKSTVTRVVKCFEDIGIVKDRPGTGRSITE